MPARSAYVAPVPGAATLRRQAQITAVTTSLKTAICTDLILKLALLLSIADKRPFVKDRVGIYCLDDRR